jgi:hypothetical protein
MNKHERVHRSRGLWKSGKLGGGKRMRFVGIDTDGERHAVAVVNEAGLVLVKSTFYGDDAAGYQRVGDLLGNPHVSVRSTPL